MKPKFTVLLVAIAISLLSCTNTTHKADLIIYGATSAGIASAVEA